jgi:signal transduction histidine kinase
VVSGDVVGVVAGTARAFAPKAADRNIALSFQDTGSPAIYASMDAMRLDQAVANLIDNALKFAQTRIDVSVFVHEGWVTISVADDGDGIAPDDLPHVFERLYVAKARPTPKESGSGLGLAIVRELIGAMGGHVAARSPVPTADGGPARGTQMLVYLRPA